MIGRKSILGIAVLCALFFSAFAATNASAAQKAYTCTEKAPPPLTFHDAHCLDTNTAPFRYGHVIITNPNTTTTGTNEKTASNTTAAEPSHLAGTLSGVITEVTCTGVHSHGTLTNAAASATLEGTIRYTGCTVTAPAGHGCVVVGGEIETKNLRATTEGQPAGSLRIEPGPGETKFATIPIEGCSGEAPPKANYPVTGKVTATLSGATITVTHPGVTGQGELKFGGNVAGIEGALTLSMAEGTTPNITAGEAITWT